MTSTPARPSAARSAARKKAAPIEPADRRKQILRAAVAVFAERGFHKTRVSDIAKRAGVAYGLIYHYFDSKDAVLNSVFEDSWGIFVKVLRDIAADTTRSVSDRLTAVSDLLVGALRLEPALVQVIIQEVSRSDRFGTAGKVDAFVAALGVVEQLIREGQASSELRADLDARVGAYAFFGALETVCTGFMMGTIACATDQDADNIKHTLRRTFIEGMRPSPTSTP